MRKKVLLLLIAMFITSLLGTPVQFLTYQLVPDMDVEISYEYSKKTDGIACIVDSDDSQNLFQDIKDEMIDAEWQIVDATESTNSYVVLNGVGSNTISFTMPMVMSKYIALSFDENSGVIVHMKTGKHERSIDLSALSDSSTFKKVYPASGELFPVLIQVAIYFLFFVVISILIIYIIPFLLNAVSKIGYLQKEVELKHFLFAFVALYIYNLIQYLVIGIPNLLSFGDQRYYWAIDLFKNGTWDPQGLNEVMVSFRGYMCVLAPTISQRISTLTGIDPLSIFYIFTAFSTAWLIFMCFPHIFELLNRKKATLLNTLGLLLIFIFFWNGLLTAVLVDLFAATAFFTGIWMFLRWYEDRKFRFACLFGVCFAISCNLRMAYKYGWIALGVVFIIYSKIKGKLKIDKKICISILLVLLSFVVVSIPQFDLNRARGHLGFMPYNSQYTEEQSLLELGMNFSLGDSYTTYPAPVSDEQQRSMESPLYQSESNLSVFQIFGVYLYSPVESLIYLLKKVFLAFDIKTNVTYPINIKWRETSGLLFSLVNYYIFCSVLFVLLKTKKVSFHEKIIASTMFVSLVLPEMIMNVEWRYYLSIYSICYYFYAYHFVEDFVAVGNDDNGCYNDEKYLLWLIIGFVMAFLISLSIWAY